MIVKGQSNNPFFGVIVLLFLLVMIWAAVTAVKGIFLILSWLALPLFVLALILNYEVVTGYIKSLWRTLRENPIKGLLYTGLSIVGYPLVSAYLAFKAMMNNRWLRPKKPRQVKGEYIKYQEVDEDDFLDLPQLEDMKETKESSSDSNKYDEMF